MTEDRRTPPTVMIAVDPVIVAVGESPLHVLLIERGIEPYKGTLTIPGGFLQDAEEDLRPELGGSVGGGRVSCRRLVHRSSDDALSNRLRFRRTASPADIAPNPRPLPERLAELDHSAG